MKGEKMQNDIVAAASCRLDDFTSTRNQDGSAALHDAASQVSSITFPVSKTSNVTATLVFILFSFSALADDNANCDTANDTGASISESVCGAPPTACGGDDSGGGRIEMLSRTACRSCGLPHVEASATKITITDTPVFLRSMTGPDLFWRWQYSTSQTGLSVMGRNISAVFTDLSLKKISNQKYELVRGSHRLTLTNRGGLFYDALNLCVAKIEGSEFAVRYKRDGVVHRFDPSSGTVARIEQPEAGAVSFVYSNSVVARIEEDGGAGRAVQFTYGDAGGHTVLMRADICVGTSVLASATFAYDDACQLTNAVDMYGYGTVFTWHNGQIVRMKNVARNVVMLSSGTSTELRYHLDPANDSTPYVTEERTAEGLTIMDAHSTNRTVVARKTAPFGGAGGPALPQVVIVDPDGVAITNYVQYLNGLPVSEWSVTLSGWPYDAWANYANTWKPFDKYYVYDANNNIKEEWVRVATNSIGMVPTDFHITRYEYYSDGNPAAPKPWDGRLKQRTSPTGAVTTYDYLDNQIVNGITCTLETVTLNTSPQTITKTYTDPQGRTIKESDGNGNYTLYEYYDEPRAADESYLAYALRYGRLQSVQTFNRHNEAAGPPTRYQYGAEPVTNGLGFIRWERETLPYQNPTTRTYDALDRLIETRFPDGAVETRSYGCCATATDVRRNGQLVSRASYDGLGRLREERRYGHPHAHIVCAFTRYAYDCVGRIVSEEEGVYLYSRPADDPLVLATATNVYDGAGRLLYHASRSGPPVRYDAYTPQGQPLVILHGADASRREARGYYADGSLAWHEPVTGRVTYFVYDGDGNTTRETDPNGTVITRKYDYAGNMTAEQYWMPDRSYHEAERAFSYDANGNLIAETSETGVKTFYTYDALNRQTSQIVDRNASHIPDADDFIETNIYALGADDCLIETRMRPGGYQQVSEYDRAGRLEREYTHPDFVTEYSYEVLFGRLTKTDAPAANNQRAVTRHEYSPAYRTASIDTLGRRTDYEYDGLGRVVQERRPDGVVRQVRYYANSDLPAVETLFDGAQILDQYFYLYDSQHTRTSVVHDIDHDTQWTASDPCTVTESTLAGEPSRVYGANVYPAEYAYDANGNLTALMDGNSNVTRFVYDYRNRLIEKLYADTNKTAFTYYQDGLLKTRRDARGIVTTYTYDALGNVTSVQYSDSTPDVVYEYNAAGLLSAMRQTAKGVTTKAPSHEEETVAANADRGDTDGGLPASATTAASPFPKGGEGDFGAGAAGPADAGRTNVERPTSNVTPDSPAEGMQDAASQASSFKYQVSSFTYYSPADPAGAGLPLLKTEINPRGTLTYAWWPNSSRQSLRVASPAGELYTATYAFDPLTRLTELSAAVPGQPATRFTYNYKAQTDLIAELRSSHGVGQTYEYDRLQRRRATAFQLTPGNDVWRESFGYNTAGFRVQRTNDFGAARPALVDSFTYDDLGQLTTATRTKNAQPRKDYFFAWRYDTVGNRVNEQRAGFSFGFWYNRLNQMTGRQWLGGLTVAGTTQPGAANAAVNAKSARMDADGEYVVEELDVTTPLLSNQGIGDGRTRDLVTAVNTNMDTLSILWETIRMAPQQVEMSYDADGNLTSDGRIAYSWDAENRLVSCEDIDLHAAKKRRSEYVYDGQMRRIEKRDYAQDGSDWKLIVTTKYLYDGWDIVAAYVTTGNVSAAHAYLYGADLSGTLGGAGGIGGLVAELRITNYNLGENL